MSERSAITCSECGQPRQLDERDQQRAATAAEYHEFVAAHRGLVEAIRQVIQANCVEHLGMSEFNAYEWGESEAVAIIKGGPAIRALLDGVDIGSRSEP